MSDHFYSVVAESQAGSRNRANIVVGTVTTGANPIEVRITDGGISKAHAYAFLEWMSDLIAAGGDSIISPGTLTLG